MFDIKDHKIIVKPEVLNIPTIHNLYKRDKSDKKEKFHSEVSYIYYMYDFNSPYANYPESERELQVKKSFLKLEWEPDQDVIEAIEEYKRAKETTSMRLLYGAKFAAEKLTDYFKGIDFTLTDDSGRPLYTAKDVAANLAAVGKIIESLNKLEEQIQKEIKDTSKIRGGGVASKYER